MPSPAVLRCSEHDLKVLLKVEHADSATNMQVIGLTHRPTGFNGRRWYFVSKNGKRAETLFLVGGFFRTRREAGLTYRSQSMGELDRALDRRRKLQAQLEGKHGEGNFPHFDNPLLSANHTIGLRQERVDLTMPRWGALCVCAGAGHWQSGECDA